MERIVVVNWTVLCVCILLFEIVSSSSYNDFHQQSARDQQGKDITDSYMLFGPKLLRKKKNSKSNDLYETPNKDFATLMDVVGNTPWTILAVNEGKRHVVNFTPRLGRESEEEFMDVLNNGDQWLQNPERSDEILSQRSPPFAPRLGRHISPFYPRLGRANDNMAFS